MSNLPKRDFYALITDATGGKVLMAEEDNLLVLPYWEAQSAISVDLQVPWVIGNIRALTGLDTVVLKDYYFQRFFEADRLTGTHRVIAVELRSGQPDPARLRWFGPTDLSDQKFAQPLHARLVQQWLHENSPDGAHLPPHRMPWARPGWFVRAAAWLTDFVRSKDWQLFGPVEQRRANTVSAQLFASTSAGKVYLKAVPPYCEAEPVFGPVLEKLLPGSVPHILHTDPANGWILTADFKGQSLADIPDFSLWEAALREYARLQIACIPHTDELLQAGARDRRLARLGEQLAAVLSRDDLWLVGQPMGLTEAEVEQLHAAPPRLQAMCQELAAFGVPETIDSGDFHANNVARTASGFVFYDWSELVITQPFMSLNPFMEYRDTFPDMPDFWERLTHAYLEPWQAFLPGVDVARAARLAFVLGSASQVLNYTYLHDHIEPEDHGFLDYARIFYTKMLLEALAKLPHNP